MSSTDSSVSRRRRPAAVVASLAVWVPLLAGAGWVADAAASASATPVLVSVTRTGPDVPTGGSSTAPTATVPHVSAVVDAPSVSVGSGGSVQQAIGVSVLPGPLTVAPATEAVSLSQLRAFGRGLPSYRGLLSPITVVDARGSLVGWRATVSLQSVAGATAGQLAHARLCASAATPTMVAGNPGDVVGGVQHSCAGVGEEVSVFWAAPQGGGGTYSDTADLTLDLPNGTLPAQVTASLAVTVH